MDVNQIFKDLATMIHDQGDMIGEGDQKLRFSFTEFGSNVTC